MKDGRTTQELLQHGEIGQYVGDGRQLSAIDQDQHKGSPHAEQIQGIQPEYTVDPELPQ